MTVLTQDGARAIMLKRLERLGDIRLNKWQGMNPAGQGLVNHALYSTYMDCMDLGMAEAAKALLLHVYKVEKGGESE